MTINKFPIYSYKIDQYRFNKDPWVSRDGDNFGMFFIPFHKKNEILQVICAPMDDVWQHVSVSSRRNIPTWEHMSYIKDLFWGPEQTVIQFHPKESEYINNHPRCLHLWKKRDEETELPPSILTGLK